MNTQLLKYIITISEEKSLSKAAEKLLITQPALSQQLKKLEKDLDARLFFRVKNEMCLTDAGKIYVNGARSALSIYNSALNEIEKMQITRKKQITMVYNKALLPSFPAAILPDFTALHLDYNISTIDGNTSVAKDYLLNNMADIAIIATRESSHGLLEYSPLGSDELLLAIPANHPHVEQFRQSGVDLNCLRDDYFILNQKNSYFRTCEQDILTNCQFNPKVICEISDLDTAVHMVSNHKGNAFLPKSMGHNSTAYECFSFQPPATFRIVIAMNKSIPFSRAIKDLIAILVHHYQSDRVRI